MSRGFWKATTISVAAYAFAIVAGSLVDFRLALFSIVALQFTWTIFCVYRSMLWRLDGAHKPDAEAYAREGYGFALGGSISSLAMFAVIVVLTQVV